MRATCGFRMCVYLTGMVLIGVTAAADQPVVLRQFPIKVSQGVAVDENYFYAISNTQIIKCRKDNARVIARWQADRNKPQEVHIRHLNSATVVGSKLYCAHSQFPIHPNKNSIEVFDVQGEALVHEKTIKMPAKYGSLTWVDQRRDGSWWICYAVYGKERNQRTVLVKYRYDKGEFTELKAWPYPPTVVSQWGSMSCSGGSWGADGFLYVTGHDRAEVYLLHIDRSGALRHAKTIKGVGIQGQAIAWDRFSPRPLLWGIVKNKHVSQNLLPAVSKQP